MPVNRTHVAAGTATAVVLGAFGLIVTSSADAASTPSAPRALTATSLSASSERLTWQPPSSAGSKPVKRYDVRDIRAGATTHTTKPTVRTYTLTKLAAKSCTYEVRAASSEGVGKWAKVTFTPGPPAPPSPTPSCALQ